MLLLRKLLHPALLFPDPVPSPVRWQWRLIRYSLFRGYWDCQCVFLESRWPFHLCTKGRWHPLSCVHLCRAPYNRNSPGFWLLLLPCPHPYGWKCQTIPPPPECWVSPPLPKASAVFLKPLLLPASSAWSRWWLSSPDPARCVWLCIFSGQLPWFSSALRKKAFRF